MAVGLCGLLDTWLLRTVTLYIVDILMYTTCTYDVHIECKTSLDPVHWPEQRRVRMSRAAVALNARYGKCASAREVAQLWERCAGRQGPHRRR